MGWTGLPVRLRVNQTKTALDGRRAIPSRSADVDAAHAGQCEEVAIRATRRLLENQFARFCAVGASGYAVNLAVYVALLGVGLHYLARRGDRLPRGRREQLSLEPHMDVPYLRRPVLGQGVRALVVSALSLGANQLFLFVFVATGAGHLAAQAVAIVLATPFSFAANKLWAFAATPSAPANANRSRFECTGATPEAPRARGGISRTMAKYGFGREHPPARTRRAALTRARARPLTGATRPSSRPPPCARPVEAAAAGCRAPEAAVHEQPLALSLHTMLVARIGQLALIFVAVTILILAMSLVANAMR